MKNSAVRKVIESDTSKSAKIRELASLGMKTAEIARTLGVSYQHAYNVLRDEAQKNDQAAKGLSERGQESFSSLHTKVHLGPDGRIVIPASFREALGFKENETLFLSVEEGELRIRTRDVALRRVQALVRRYIPEGVSLVDELLEDRRREVAEEERRG